MRIHLPLSAKILVWFFLNVILLGIGFFLFFYANFGFDAVFSALAKPRVQAVAEVVNAEIAEHKKSEWDKVMARNSNAYGMTFSLFYHDGGHLAGEKMELPDEVKSQLVGSRKFPEPNRPPPPPPRGAGPPRGHEPPPPEEEGTSDGFPKFLISTFNPPLFWAVVRIPIGGPFEQKRPFTLIIRSDSVHVAGLFFDLKPVAILGIGALLLSVLFWIPLVTSLTYRLRKVKEATAKIAQGDFTAIVPDEKRDEIGDLGHSVNQMAAQLSSLVNGQRRLLGDIAHELCSPIARMQAAIGIVDQSNTDEKTERYISRIGRELRHMSDLVNELLSFSKASLRKDVVLRPVKLLSIVERVLEWEAAGDRGNKIEVSPALMALAEPELLARAMGNVVRNAIRYAEHAGSITIKGWIEGDEAVVAIMDEGPGVPPEALPKLFDAFYRPDLARSRDTGGAGLGLAIVKSCIETCKGTVTARNREPHGLIVEFRLLQAIESSPSKTNEAQG